MIEAVTKTYQTIKDLLDDLDDVALIDIHDGRNGIGHVYEADDIDCIDEDLLNMPFVTYLVVSKSYGLEVHIEVDGLKKWY